MSSGSLLVTVKWHSNRSGCCSLSNFFLTCTVSGYLRTGWFLNSSSGSGRVPDLVDHRGQH